MSASVATSASVIVEVRAAEGGEHAKELVEKQVGVYVRYCTRRFL